MIYKLQRSLYPKDERLLITSADGAEWIGELPMNPETLALFGDELRIFAEAEIINGEFTINAVVPDPREGS